MNKPLTVIIVMSIVVIASVGFGTYRLSVLPIPTPRPVPSINPIKSTPTIRPYTAPTPSPQTITGNFPTSTQASCRTLGGLMVTTSNGKGQIGCDIIVTGNFNLSRSYCEGQTTRQRAALIRDRLGRANQYYATLRNLNPDEEVKVYIYSPSGERIECTPSLNTGK